MSLKVNGDTNARSSYIRSVVTRLRSTTKPSGLSAAKTYSRPSLPENGSRKEMFVVLYANGAPVRIKLRTPMLLRFRCNFTRLEGDCCRIRCFSAVFSAGRSPSPPLGMRTELAHDASSTHEGSASSWARAVKNLRRQEARIRVRADNVRAMFLSCCSPMSLQASSMRPLISSKTLPQMQVPPGSAMFSRPRRHVEMRTSSKTTSPILMATRNRNPRGGSIAALRSAIVP
jgi:hypothetical protein